MLTIRPDQIKVFSAYLVQAFRERMLQRATEVHPKRLAEFGKPAVIALIDKLTQRGLKQGIPDDRDLSDLIDLFLTAGLRTDERLDQPWAQEILKSTAGGSAKVGLIALKLTGKLPNS